MFSFKRVFEKTFDRNCVFCLSKNNLLYFVAEVDVVTVMDFKTKRLIDTIDVESLVIDLQTTKCGRFILAACFDDTGKIVDLQTKNCVILKGHTDDVNCIAECGDTDVLTCSDDKTIRRWNRFTGELIRTYSGHGGAVKCILFSVEKKIIISGTTDFKILLWNSESGEKIGEMTGHTDWLRSLAFFDATKIVSVSSDQTVKVWDIATKQRIKTIAFNHTNVNSITITSDGKYIITGSWDEIIRVWSVSTGECVKSITFFNKWITQVDITENGKYLFVGFVNGYSIQEITPALSHVIHESTGEVNGDPCTMKLLANGCIVNEKGEDIHANTN